MEIIKKLFWLALLVPATAQAQYYGVTPSTATGRATMRLSGQELVYASSAAVSPSIILQGNGGRITATGGITVSSATVKGNATIIGNAAVGGTLGVTGAATMSGGATLTASGGTVLSIDRANVEDGSSAFNLSRLPATSSSNTGKVFAFTVGSNSLASGMFYSNGAYGIGSGLATRDVFIRRSDTNTMQIATDPVGATGGNLAVTGTLAVSGAASVGGAMGVSGTLSAPGGISASSATMSGNVAIGTTTAQTRLNVYGGDIRVQGDSSGFGTVPTSGEGLEIAYDSVNHYAWFGAYNRTTAAYTGNYMDGSTLGLNYYSKGPVAIGGNTSAPGLALTYGISAATAAFTGTATIAVAKITGSLQIPTGASSGYLLASDASGNASWTAPATGGVVLTATQTFSGANIFTSSTVFNGGMFRGPNLLDVPAIVSSGTFRMGSMYITTPMNDNQTYDLVMIASCTAATPIYARVNYQSTAVYEWLRTYKTSSGTNSYAVTTISGLLLGNANSAGDEVIINAKFAVHTSGWTHGLSYAATSIGSYASSGSMNEEIGGGWTITGTQVNNLTINTDGGICSGKYKLTTTGW